MVGVRGSVRFPLRFVRQGTNGGVGGRTGIPGILRGGSMFHVKPGRSAADVESSCAGPCCRRCSTRRRGPCPSRRPRFLAGFVDVVVGGGGLIQVPALFAVYPQAAPGRLLGANKLSSIAGAAVPAVRYSEVLPPRPASTRGCRCPRWSGPPCSRLPAPAGRHLVAPRCRAAPGAGPADRRGGPHFPAQGFGPDPRAPASGALGTLCRLRRRHGRRVLR